MYKFNQRMGKENRLLELCENEGKILGEFNIYMTDIINILIFKFLFIKLCFTFIK